MLLVANFSTANTCSKNLPVHLSVFVLFCHSVKGFTEKSSGEQAAAETDGSGKKKSGGYFARKKKKKAAAEATPSSRSPEESDDEVDCSASTLPSTEACQCLALANTYSHQTGTALYIGCPEVLMKAPPCFLLPGAHG